MSRVSGVTANPSSGCHLWRPGTLSRSRRLLPPTIPCAARNNHNDNKNKNHPGFLLRLDRRRICLPGGYLRRCNDRTKNTHFANCAMEASYSGGSEGDWSSELGEPVVFPRINVRDPYKRLGISREASEDEIQGARNFLVRKYARHKPSVDAIESAHDKIIMQKFYERKNPKIDISKKVREVKQSKFLQAVSRRFQTPSTMVIVKTSIVFLVLGVLTVLFPTEDGPTLQVAISLTATLYFINDRLKSKIRAILYAIGAFMFSWLFGTFLMVSVIPPLPFIKGMRSFEATTSLITYVLLWVSSTYLK